MTEPSMKKPDARFYLANERTLLAWIRTSIGIMAFGFVVVKFSLFLRQFALLAGQEVILPEQGYSSVIGVLLVAAGALILVFAYLNFKRTQQQLLEDNYRPSSRLLFTITMTILAVSILLILYLVGGLF